MAGNYNEAPKGATSTRRRTIAVCAPVFFVSGALVLLFLALGVSCADQTQAVLSTVQVSLATHFGWLYVLGVAFLMGFVVWLAFSRYGRIRLGPDDSKPQFGNMAWFAMLFSAGMGIGLLFYGVAEPIMQYSDPPTGIGQTPEAAREALSITLFHWGIHAWAIYVVMGLAIAYFAYRMGLPLALRSTLYPLLGERVRGFPGHVVDILAVFGTIFGLATSLGLGSMQINAGLAHLFDVPYGRGVQLLIIAIITACATLSLVTGVNRGIRRLSELNIVLAALLMSFVFLVGPSVHLLDALVENVGRYLSSFVERTFWMDALGDGIWHRDWTLSYWGWWIAWSPFVGMFIARISRGRTIREFILGVLLVPTLVTFLWLTVFGNTALFLELGGGGIADAVSSNVATAVYVVLEKLPLAGLTCILAALVVAVFFVTSSDSASFVVDMLTSGGHPDPPRWQRVFWATTEGAVAAVLLVTTGKGGLSAMQTAVLCIGVPFCVLLVVMCFSLLSALRQEKLP